MLKRISILFFYVPYEKVTKCLKRQRKKIYYQVCPKLTYNIRSNSSYFFWHEQNEIESKNYLHVILAIAELSKSAFSSKTLKNNEIAKLQFRKRALGQLEKGHGTADVNDYSNLQILSKICPTLVPGGGTSFYIM